MNEALVIRAPEGDASRHSEGHQVRIDGRLWQVHQGQWVRVPEPDALRLEPSIPNKGGHNDLSRWEKFGGTLKRPGPPASISSKSYAAGGNGSAI